MSRSSQKVRDVVPGGDDQRVPVGGGGEAQAASHTVRTLQQAVVVGLPLPQRAVHKHKVEGRHDTGAAGGGGEGGDGGGLV